MSRGSIRGRVLGDLYRRIGGRIMHILVVLYLLLLCRYRILVVVVYVGKSRWDELEGKYRDRRGCSRL